MRIMKSYNGNATSNKTTIKKINKKKTKYDFTNM